MNQMAATRFIDFTDLLVDKNGPHGNAWGLWGADDQLGTLNYLTDEVVKVAANEEIRTGTRVSLKSIAWTMSVKRFGESDNDSWSMMGPSKPRFPRKFTEVKLINKAPMKTAHDEEVSNTQFQRFETSHMILHLPYSCTSIHRLARNGMEPDITVIRTRRWEKALHHRPSYL